MAEPSPPNSIFICYRRADSEEVTGRIYDRLVAEFGTEAVYRDVDTIPFGEDFQEHIQESLSKCLVGLVIIGPDWCTIAGRSGLRRLDEPGDHVRVEVEAMPLRGAMKIIPLFVRCALPPEPDMFPKVLEPLAFRNGPHIRRDPDFHHDMNRLVEQLRRHLGPAPETGPSTETSRSSARSSDAALSDEILMTLTEGNRRTIEEIARLVGISFDRCKLLLGSLYEGNLVGNTNQAHYEWEPSRPEIWHLEQCGLNRLRERGKI